MESKHDEVFGNNEVILSVCRIIGGRKRAKTMSVEGLQNEIQKKFSRTYTRSVLIEGLRKMQEIFPDCQFVPGRRGKKSRFVFRKSLIARFKGLEAETEISGKDHSVDVIEGIDSSPKFVGTIKTDCENTREHIVSVSAGNCIYMEFPENGLTEDETNKLIAFVRALAS
ncbi:MAG: hypothetical protein AB7V06_28295 [Candidatus Obscuribacterales bacterium]